MTRKSVTTNKLTDINGTGLEDDRVKILCYAGYDVDWHQHTFYELVLISQGSCLHHCSGKQQILIQGDYFLIPPGVPHSYSMSRQVEIINCLIDKDIFAEEWLKINLPQVLINDPQAVPLIHLSSEQLLFVRMLLNQVRDVCRLTDPEKRPVDQHIIAYSPVIPNLSGKQAFDTGRSCLYLALVSLLENFRQSNTIRNDGNQAGRRTVGMMLDYIQEHYQEQISIEQLAAQVFISTSHCRRLFKQYLGYSPVTFINRLRVDMALPLIKCGRYSVAEVALRVGFADAGYLSRVFRKEISASPRDFLPR